MRSITIHVSDETAAAVERYAKKSGQALEYERSALRTAELSHNLRCDDPECEAHQAIAKGYESIEQIELVDCFMSDVVSSLRCAAKVPR